MEKTSKIERVIADTGIVYALADKKDAWHERAVRFVEDFQGRLVLPSTTIPEICYLLNSCLGAKAELIFVNALINRELAVEHITHGDLIRSAELLQAHKDLNIGMVDASVAAIAERLNITHILTADRRLFSVIKPKHCKTFTLLP